MCLLSKYIKHFGFFLCEFQWYIKPYHKMNHSNKINCTEWYERIRVVHYIYWVINLNSEIKLVLLSKGITHEIICKCGHECTLLCICCATMPSFNVLIIIKWPILFFSAMSHNFFTSLHARPGCTLSSLVLVVTSIGGYFSVLSSIKWWGEYFFVKSHPSQMDLDHNILPSTRHQQEAYGIVSYPRMAQHNE